MQIAKVFLKHDGKLVFLERRIILYNKFSYRYHSGMTYNAPPQVGQHRDTIQPITSGNPDDPQSPFWDENS